MKKFLQLMCMSVILLMSAGCDDNADDSDLWMKVCPTETWEMTYDDYRSLLDKEQTEYRHLKRVVGIVRTKDYLYIKGIFPKYPKAWIKGKMDGNDIHFEDGLYLSGSEYVPVYSHFGTAANNFYYSYGNHCSFEWIEFRSSTQAVLRISAGGDWITANDDDEGNVHVAFWYDFDVNGFKSFDKDDMIISPEGNYMINVEFRKIRDADKDNFRGN